ncbi:SEA domain-containing protein [Caerostris extrusa]|uniref:SEA domain-containing protein n=1 Tax=Caerostris extrusa TaxID=172846 RepID=A0AAV4TC63_CAEEX|nr:SEA domain-containing protein [Caerostris extrusa]
MNKDNQKIFIVPANFGDPVKESDKNNFPSMEIKPTLFIPEFYEKGLDNPAYYDPADVRRTARMDAKKQKFTSKSIPGESDGAKLTKIPGLNIWRLDFRKPSSKSPANFCTLVSTDDHYSHAGHYGLDHQRSSRCAHAIKGGVIFGMPWFPFEGENEALGVDRVAAHFRIMNRQFVSELHDHSSKRARALDVLFMDSPLINFYNASDNFEFTPTWEPINSKQSCSVGVNINTVAPLLQWRQWNACVSKVTGLNGVLGALVYPLTICATPSQIQRRTRNCFGFKSKTLPTTVCHRKSGESAIQIRHCICEQSHDDESTLEEKKKRKGHNIKNIRKRLHALDNTSLIIRPKGLSERK